MPRDFPKPDQFAGVVANGSDDHTGPKPGAVLADAPAFIFEASFLGRHLEFPLRFATLQICGRVKTRKMLADNLRALISLDTLCAVVPTNDMSGRVEHEDGIVLYRFHEQTKSFLALSQLERVLQCLSPLQKVGDGPKPLVHGAQSHIALTGNNPGVPRTHFQKWLDVPVTVESRYEV